uniref:Tricarboxylate transport membrane protein TctA n=1 Tax=uncultured Thiotrichaceae bacterium TaxID=298394 RepID=A0A6S6UJ59_9GAMM|nr:MAG: Tricarboxylate transport membrane protein TctA [uncultured Thiotrichaceae bacterium]
MEFLSYFHGVFEPLSLLLLIGGTIGGLILGATPGLSPTMAVALLIPFTFQLQPAQGLILLGAAYTSTVAGGAVSAILLKIPGAPANIATALDGNAMAKNGQGTRALQLSFLSSGVGGVFGVMLLIFLTPVLAEWALAFGPSQLFWLAILGVTVIGTLDSDSFVKGLLSGCIGLWISMIGYDDVQGAQRFIFSDALAGGVNIIAALIGLFAIPQVIDMFSKGRNHVALQSVKTESHRLSEAAGELFKRKRALSIGTIVGSIVGLIPGVGGQIAGLVAYDQSKKLSPEKDKFGTGHSEGLIAAESANNAMVGPSLVPLLTLSIPGSPTAAVLLGGLLIHGIFPGSDLFERHPDVAWTFINSMLIGQILMVIIGIYTAVWVSKISRVPVPVMSAAVLVLALFGSYSVQQSMGDVSVMFVLGVMMYFLQKFGFSAAPLVLGLILGPIAEANFVQGSMIGTAMGIPVGFFLEGPLNILLIALVVISIAYSFWSHRKYNAKEKEALELPWKQHVATATIILLIAIAVVWFSFMGEPAEAFLFPRILSSIMLGLAVWNAYRAWSGLIRVGVGLGGQEFNYMLPGLIVSLGLVFFFAKFIGFYVASTVSFFIVYSVYDPAPLTSLPSWLKRLGITAGFMLVIYLLFAVLLQVQTPRGLIL